MFKKLFSSKTKIETFRILIEDVSEDTFTYWLPKNNTEANGDPHIWTENDKIPEICPINAVPEHLRKFLISGASAYLEKEGDAEIVLFDERDLG